MLTHITTPSGIEQGFIEMGEPARSLVLPSPHIPTPKRSGAWWRSRRSTTSNNWSTSSNESAWNRAELVAHLFLESPLGAFAR